MCDTPSSRGLVVYKDHVVYTGPSIIDSLTFLGDDLVVSPDYESNITSILFKIQPSLSSTPSLLSTLKGYHTNRPRGSGLIN